MKRRFAVLVITDSEETRRAGRFSRLLSSVRPGNRLQNYSEFLSGSGIPFETVLARNFSPEQVVDAQTIRFSTIIVACRTCGIADSLQTRIAELSSRFGISLITDAFLSVSSRFLSPFGILRCAGLPKFSGQILDDEGNVLYRAIPHPYSSKGLGTGIRPFLRMLLQNWFARRIVVAPGVGVSAVHENGFPAIVSHTFGGATNHFLNFHPALVLKDGNPVHAQLRRLITARAHAIPVSLSMEGIGILRMDDPGSAERVHLEGFNEGVLSATVWQEIIHVLRETEAHLSVSIVPHWVDDGDAGKGRLSVDGQVIEARIPGAHYPSWDVEFRRKDRAIVYDYVTAFRAIRKGVEEGVISILSHGLTHITPHQNRWLAAQDRFTNTRWYREFSSEAGGVVARMQEGARLLNKYFGTVPDILVPSGHQFIPKTPARAGLAGFRVFSSKSTFLLDGKRIFENRKIRAVYPDESFEGVPLAQAGYPLIVVLHDYDLLQEGSARLNAMIRQWRARGIRRFLPMQTLALALAARLEVVCREDGSVQVDLDFSAYPAVVGIESVLWLKIEGRPATAAVNGNLRSEDLTWNGEFSLFPVRLAEAVENRWCLILRFEENP